MSTHPYIPFYVDDFEGATAHLSLEEDGLYNRLLRLAWRTPGCSLPDDAAWIARKVRLSPDDFERLGRPILIEFFTLKRGRFVQKRLKDEYDDISRKKDARKQAGKKGGSAKAQNRKDNSPSIATDLLGDVRAFPNPEPEPEPIVRSEAVASVPLHRGSRISPDWRPSAEDQAYAMAQGLSPPEVERIAADFRDFWKAKAGKDAVKLDWPATWQKWTRTEADKRGVAARRAAPRRLGVW